MNTDPKSPDVLEISDAEALAPAPSSAHGWSKRDQAPLPARSLGPKASVLQARRQRMRPSETRRTPSTHGNLLETDDGALSFMMRGTDSGLYLERTQRRPLGTHLTLSMVFACAAEFKAWCDAEPLKFDNPNLHQRLQRRGEEFFDANR